MLFADDTNIFISGNTAKEAYSKANILLKSIHQYMYLNKLHVNKSKCCYIHFKPETKNKEEQSENGIDLSLKINEHPIKKVSSTKFLGVHIHENLNWKFHIKECYKRNVM